MNSKIIFSFLFGLFIGFGVGYVVTDIHYRKTELKIPETANPATNNPMDDVHRQLNALQEIIKRNPEDWNALVGLGNLYYDINQFDKAIPYYQRAVEIKKDPNVLADLGTCLRETGRAMEAIKIYEEVLKIDPKHWRSIYNIIIVSIHDLKDKKRAETYFEKLKELNPAEVNLNLLYEEIQKLK
ncbi:MAG: tetratricopeptide repeat protein [Thermoanaerobaculia bacterium]